MGLKSQNPDLKLILSVGGWTHGTATFSLAATNTATMQTFASNALVFINNNNLDGIDIDWEYPDGADVAKYPEFLEILRSTFPSNLMVTAAMGAYPSRRESSYTDTARICAALDYVHLMTYDMHGGWESVIGHHSPWVTDGTHPNDPNQVMTVKASVDSWLGAGCPAEKVTIGFGSYGRGFVASGTVDRTYPGTATAAAQYTGEAGYLAYYEICNFNSIYIDPNIQSAVAVSGSTWVGFETPESAEVKLQYLVEKGMAGTMWWTLDLDDFNGQFCGDGSYPLIGGVKAKLEEIENGNGSGTTPPTDPPVTTDDPGTTQQPATEVGCSDIYLIRRKLC